MEISLSLDGGATYYHAQAIRGESLMKRATAIAAAALLAQLATAQAAEGWRYGLAADVMHDDNATRGLYDADQKGDTVLTAEGSAVRSFMLGPRSGALLRAAARYSHFTTFDDLSNLALSGRAAWRAQPGLGYSAPIYEVAGSLTWLQHADSELRDGTIARGQRGQPRHRPGPAWGGPRFRYAQRRRHRQGRRGGDLRSRQYAPVGNRRLPIRRP